MSRANPAGPVAPGTNLVVIRGTVSRDPELRVLPSGDTLLALEVTVRSAAPSSAPAARAESVPVAWFAPPASAHFAAADEVVVVGRVRRRFFRAGTATASRTEVVADRVVPVRAAARVRSAIARGLAALDATG